MQNITYTFSQNCPIQELRGITVTCGVFCRADGRWNETPDAVRFAERIAGRDVIAKIAGKPELEAALAAHLAEKLAVKNRMAAMGWPQYSAARDAFANASAAYDRASEYGYPAREAQSLAIAEKALAAAGAQYPLAAAYAKAERYSSAAHDSKASAGRVALAKIEAGGDAEAAIAEMERTWSAAAKKAVDNA